MVILSCASETCQFVTLDIEAVAAAALLNNHSSTAHSNSNQGHANTQDRAARPVRPLITPEITPHQWANTERYWNVYKKAARLNVGDTTTQLITCCDVELRDRLFDTHSDIEEKSEADVLKAIKQLAVKQESVILSQVNHLKCRQGRDEPFRQFYSRVKAYAIICDYNITFTEGDNTYTKSYADKVLRQIIVANMADADIQIDLLSILNASKTPMTLDEMVSYIEAKENGKQSSLKLSSMHSTNALHSTYKRSIKSPVQTYSQATVSRPNNSTEKCSHCNTYGHGNNWGFNRAHIRKKLGCPAYGNKCSRCQKMGHFEAVCRISPTQRQSTAAAETEQEDHMIGGAISIQQD